MNFLRQNCQIPYYLQATTKITTIKLDKNFDIKVKGVKALLEQGYDENRGMKYYKLYYEEEK